MLVKIDFLSHKVNNLLRYFENYLMAIKDLPKGQVFNITNCPDTDLSQYITTDKHGKDSDLKIKFIEFHQSFLELNKSNRKKFLKIFKDTNNMPWILNNPTKAVRKANYPGKTGSTTHALLKHLFEKTMSNDAFDLKGHYKKFYDSRVDRWCPFCGMEMYKVPERQKEDYDHLLCKKHYPAAAINMKNLFPMGEGCNRRYKKDIDVLNSLKKATKVIHPYSEYIKPTISLSGSKIHSSESKCKWKVSVNPKTDKVKAWNVIFKIDERCKEEYLVKRAKSKQDPLYKEILKTLIQHCQLDRKRHGIDWTWNDLEQTLKYWVNVYKPVYYQDSNMVKIGLYQFLINEADHTYQLALVDMINKK